MARNAIPGNTSSSRRRLGLALSAAAALAPILTSAGTTSAAGPDLLDWPDCPPGIPYAFSGSNPAHFQASPVAGPSGGSCSLEVVSGAVFVPVAGSSGGVAFSTPGEVAGNTYTLAFDFQWVEGQNPWAFVDENGDGVVNGLNFSISFPGDDCWRHYQFTAPLGPNGPRSTLYVFQGQAGPQEMRIDNMTLEVASPNAPLGLTVGGPSACSCGS